MAADAVIDDMTVTTAVDDYVAQAEWDRLMDWRYLQPQCTATEAGPSDEVTCTYVMENALSRALDVGPYSGSSFELVIADGQIEQVTNNVNYALYSPQVFEVFTAWLDDTYPGDRDRMFEDRLTPEALALFEQRVPEFEAVGTALRFLKARDTWDGETVRSLLAADAVIDDMAVTTVEDYAANTDFERITEWRYQLPRCSGPPAELTCTYWMRSALTLALGVGSYSGNSCEFEIAEGRIQQVTNNFDSSQYSGEAFEVFTAWLDETHPGDSDVMLDTAPDGSAIRNTTPESLALWEQRIPEFVSSLSGS